jgi:predicted O-linked N-acetylglucosamine transferase (SPINDLY family)
VLVERRPRADYLRLYHDVDIGLDPFPCAGHTTSLDALWMGVPVVTLAGRAAVGRGTLSLLSTLGLTDLVAETPEAYARIATALAADQVRLAALRAGLRERVRRSPLGDAPRLTRHLEAGYRAMWVAWCAGAVHGRGRTRLRG